MKDMEEETLLEESVKEELSLEEEEKLDLRGKRSNGGKGGGYYLRRGVIAKRTDKGEK